MPVVEWVVRMGDTVEARLILNADGSCQIGQTIKTGKTEAKINLLAIRRVQLRIDRELKKTTYNPTP